ncbi:DUF945 family protein [Thorsellia anophelis]|nr:DUF945 family protein [Thorsellia anophelis]
MSWIKGSQIDESIDIWISQQNKTLTTGAFISTRSEAGLFERRYQISYVQAKEGKNHTEALIESNIIFSYGLMQQLFKEGDIAIDLKLVVNDLSHFILSSIDNLPVKDLLIERLKPNSRIEGLVTVIYDSEKGLLGNFKTINLPDVVVFDTLEFEDITGTFATNLNSMATHITINQPNIKVLSKTEPTTSNEDITNIAQIIIPTAEIANINDLNISFDLDKTATFTDLQLSAKTLSIDTLQANNLNVSMKASQREDVPLVELESTLTSSSIIYSDKSFGDLSIKLGLGNIDLNTLKKAIDTAHIRFESDKVDGINKFPLSVYYFTQWLQNKETFLANYPSFTISEFKAKNQNINFSSSLTWQFQPSGQESDLYINPLITSIFNHTQTLSFDMMLNQSALRQLLSIIFSFNDEKQIDDYLFVMNEMNKTRPFLEISIQHPNIQSKDTKEESKASLDLLNPNSVAKFNFSFNSLKREVVWLNKVFKLEEFRTYINHLTQQD